MHKHWLKSYPDGVAHEIDPEQFRSLNQLLEESFPYTARTRRECLLQAKSHGLQTPQIY